MSDNQTPGNSEQEPLHERALAASPLGLAAMILGAVFAIVFWLRFRSILDNVNNDDLRSAIQALEITVVAVWIAIILWGWYLVKDSMERANTNRRLGQQATSLTRIERALSDMDQEKEELTQKSRSFWNFRRENPSGRD